MSERERDREREIEREIESEREREREREAERMTEREKDNEREREREIAIERERAERREREKERAKEREREREREPVSHLNVYAKVIIHSRTGFIYHLCVLCFTEEILKSNSAHWWSPDGSYICYGQFNDSDVPRYKHPFYGDGTNIYGDTVEIAYPKVTSSVTKLATPRLYLIYKQN